MGTIKRAARRGGGDYHSVRPLVSGQDRLVIVEKKDLKTDAETYHLIVMHGDGAISQHMNDFETPDAAHGELRLTVTRRCLEKAEWRDASAEWLGRGPELNDQDERTRQSFRGFLRGALKR